MKLIINTLGVPPRSRLAEPSFASHLKKQRKAFTLVELLFVMTIIGILTALTIPALSSLNNSGNVNRAVNGISQLLDESRAFAMAHDTYVWVGFSQDSTTQKLTVGVVAGTTGQMSDLNSVATYFPVTKLQTYDHFSLKSISGLSGMAANGDDIATSAVGTFQQTGSGKTVSFTEILQFSPQGEVSINPAGSTVHWIQIGLQPILRNNDPDVAVVQIASLTGRVQVFRP